MQFSDEQTLSMARQISAILKVEAGKHVGFACIIIETRDDGEILDMEVITNAPERGELARVLGLAHKAVATDPRPYQTRKISGQLPDE